MTVADHAMAAKEDVKAEAVVVVDSAESGVMAVVAVDSVAIAAEDRRRETASPLNDGMDRAAMAEAVVARAETVVAVVTVADMATAMTARALKLRPRWPG